MCECVRVSGGEYDMLFTRTFRPDLEPRGGVEGDNWK